MEFPLISRALIANFKLVHGLFNLTLLCLFIYQGSCGLQIRKARRGGAPLPLPAIRRHRRLGPNLAVLGGAGFCAGFILVFLDTGNVLSYPLHLIAGMVILALLLRTYLVSRKITSGDNPWRELHLRLGIAILAAYLFNVIVGVGVLL
jgi:hypothetical protein